MAITGHATEVTTILSTVIAKWVTEGLACLYHYQLDAVDGRI